MLDILGHTGNKSQGLKRDLFQWGVVRLGRWWLESNRRWSGRSLGGGDMALRLDEEAGAGHVRSRGMAVPGVGNSWCKGLVWLGVSNRERDPEKPEPGIR